MNEVRDERNELTDPPGSPRRVQRKRIKGWRMPPNTVSVCRPGKWGNPFRVGDGLHTTAQQCVDAYERWLTSGESYTHEAAPPSTAELAELRGKNLACFCPLDQPCHADVLLSLANTERTRAEGVE